MHHHWFVLVATVAVSLIFVLVQTADEEEKRSIVDWPTSPVHPTPLQVAAQTEHTKGMSWLIRTGLSLERKWYDLTADKGPVAIGALVALGVVTTFLVVFVPLFYLFGGFSSLLLPGIGKRSLNKRSLKHHQEQQQQQSADFSLIQDDWMDQLKQWATVDDNQASANATSRRYRCCLFTMTQPDHPEGFARCFPLPVNTKYIYPWNNPCPRNTNYKDVLI